MLKEKLQKQQLGQFMTKNYEYILQNIHIPKFLSFQTIVEPFCGEGDLLKFVENSLKKYNLECYDIDPKKDFIIKRDTLKNPPNYSNKFVITNPPYLARNKSKNKEIYDLYNVNDLYKAFLCHLIKNSPEGGIVIIPLNFWSSIRESDVDLRKRFLDKFYVSQLNIFEEQVFSDTSYTVCSFQFQLLNNDNDNILTNVDIYPSKTNIKIKFDSKNLFMIGGHIYNLTNDEKYNVSRLTSDNMYQNTIKNKYLTNIIVKCIDDSIKNKINLSINDNLYIDNTPNKSCRTYASLIIEPMLSAEEQIVLVNKFNIFLNKNRDKYNSLFLNNYRESKDSFARKRISFELVYNIIKHLLTS